MATCATRLGSKYCLMLQGGTKNLTKHITRDKSVRNDKEKAIVYGHHLQNHSLVGGCLSVGFPVHLLSLSFAPKQEKLIHNHLCFQTEVKVNISDCESVSLALVQMKMTTDALERQQQDIFNINPMLCISAT